MVSARLASYQLKNGYVPVDRCDDVPYLQGMCFRDYAIALSGHDALLTCQRVWSLISFTLVLLRQAIEWKRKLPLEPIFRLLEFFLPKIEAIVKAQYVLLLL